MKKFFVIAASAALALLTGCKKDITVTPANLPDFQEEISIRSMAGVTKSAINTTTFPVGYDMMVSAYKNVGAHAGEDVSASYFEGIQFTKTGDTWKSARGPKYYPIDGTLDFLAVASAGYKTAGNGIAPTAVWGESGNVAKKVVLTVPANHEKFDDLLYASNNAQSSSPSGTAMQFKHAMTSVCFTAKCNVAYNAETNTGITINSITIDNAKHSGTLTISNPSAGGGTGTLSAEWSSLGSAQTHVAARVWAAANTGINPSEPALTGLNLGTTSKAIASYPFGEAYVILPPQGACSFTINYTIHNGFMANNTTAQDNTVEYQITPTGNWEMGKKYIYDLQFSLTEIQIVPTVVDWDNQTATNVIP